MSSPVILHLLAGVILVTQLTRASHFRPIVQPANLQHQQQRSYVNNRLWQHHQAPTSDRRASSSSSSSSWAAHNQLTPNNQFARQPEAPPTLNGQTPDNQKLLICYYTTRQTAPYWPKDAREFVIPAHRLSQLGVPLGEPLDLQPKVSSTSNGASSTVNVGNFNDRYPNYQHVNPSGGKYSPPFATAGAESAPVPLVSRNAGGRQMILVSPPPPPPMQRNEFVPQVNTSSDLPIDEASIPKRHTGQLSQLFFMSPASRQTSTITSRQDNALINTSPHQTSKLEQAIEQNNGHSVVMFAGHPASSDTTTSSKQGEFSRQQQQNKFPPALNNRLNNGGAQQVASFPANDKIKNNGLEQTISNQLGVQLSTSATASPPTQLMSSFPSPPPPSPSRSFVSSPSPSSGSGGGGAEQQMFSASSPGGTPTPVPPPNSNNYFYYFNAPPNNQTSTTTSALVGTTLTLGGGGGGGHQRAKSLQVAESELTPASGSASVGGEAVQSTIRFPSSSSSSSDELQALKQTTSSALVTDRPPLVITADDLVLNRQQQQQQQQQTLSSSLVSSPLSTMFDVFGAASQYLMRFKPSSLISPAAFLEAQQGGGLSHGHAHSLGSGAGTNGSSLFSSLQAKSMQANSSGGGGFLSRLTLRTSKPELQRREDICGRTIQTPERRIIGGEGARYGEFPYQVHIKIAKHQCGGALIDRQSIVTAAHCVYHFITRAPVSKLQIVIGAYDIEDEQYQELPPQYFKVNKVKLHPNFRFSASHPDRYDIAILKLDKPVKYTDNVLPVCLPSARDLKFENQVGTVTGFGKTDPSLSNRYGTRLLQKVDVPIIENQECERWHRTRGIDLKIFPEMMCAGYEDGLKDACVGDSGGPLVVKTPTGSNGSFRWTLAGITSAGFGCAQSRQPGIYHRVSHTVDWILENLD